MTSTDPMVTSTSAAPVSSSMDLKKGQDASDRRSAAAVLLIQRHYRGYRLRREMDGLRLSKADYGNESSNDNRSSDGQPKKKEPMNSDVRWSDALLRLQQERLNKQAAQEDKNDPTHRWQRGGFMVKQLVASGSQSGIAGKAEQSSSSEENDASSKKKGNTPGGDGPVAGGSTLGDDAPGRTMADAKPEDAASVAPTLGKVGNTGPEAQKDGKIDNVPLISKPNQRGLRLIEKWTGGSEAQEISKNMEAQYWLELVDSKHRYGSSLKFYHAAWMQSDSKENFFYWLDHGGGKHISLPERPRDQLERERITYLSADQRRNYIVDVGPKDGKLYWRRNGRPIDTTKGRWKDLGDGHGITEVGEEEMKERERICREKKAAKKGRGKDKHTEEASHTGKDDDAARVTSSSASSSSDSSDHEDSDEVSAEAEHYGGDHKHKGITKPLNAFTTKGLTDRLLRKTVQANTWIYVLNTRKELYVGIKTTGRFQHSSFLFGGRVLSAGLLRVKDGVLQSLSPLSGHYRAGTAHFRHFVSLLQDKGVDLSQVHLSKSLIMLTMIEKYGEVKSGKGKQGKEGSQDKQSKKDFRKLAKAEKKRLEDEDDDANGKRATGFRAKLDLK